MQTRPFVLVALVLFTAPVFAGGLIDSFGQPVWQLGGTQAGANFGFSVTTAGDVDGDGYNDVLVGVVDEDSTLTDEGGAYLYRGSKNGTAHTPSWAYHGRQLNAYAGYVVAPAGDVNNDGYADVMVGVPFWDAPGHPNAGKVVVFHGGPNGLSLTPAYELFAPTITTDQNFGISIAPAWDYNGDGYADVVVGSRLASGADIIGSAYVYEGGVGGLFTTPVYTAFGWPVGNSHMGDSVSGAGDINADGFADLILGSPGDSRTFSNGGSAVVLFGKANGVAELDTLIQGTAAGATLGTSVSAAGDVNGDGYADVVIGSPGLNSSTGTAKIGFGGPQGITSVVDLPVANVGINDNTGMRVATLGDINADGMGDFGVVSRDFSGTNRGRVTVFLGSRTGPEFLGDILARGNDGFFGACLGTTGDTNGDGFSEILVGSEDISVQAGQHEGVAYQFKPPRSGLRLASNGWPRLSPDPGTGYGSAVAVLPRFDGGDAAKLVIGNPQYGGNGRVTMHYGVDSWGVNPSEQSAWAAPPSFWSYGARIVDAGDTDGDSYNDYAVSGTTADSGGVSQVGRVLLHRGGLGSLPQPYIVLSGTSEFDRVGSALAGRGDVNGDGYHDLLIGAREWDEPSKADAGKVWLYFGSPTGLLASPPWTRVGVVAGQGLGASVALTDLDADGYTDVIVGSSSPVLGATAAGKVEVYFGGPAGPANTPGLTYLAPVPEVSFGKTVAAIGDVTGDDIADLAIGAPQESGHGVVRIYDGGLGRSPALRELIYYQGTQVDERFGEVIAGGGDVDGDGFGDFAIGAPGWDGPEANEGRIALYHGGANYGELAKPPLYVESNIVGAALGASIAPFRDINLDGFADVIAGAPGDVGRVYPFMGGGTFGRRLELDPYDYGLSNHAAVHPARSHDPDQVAAIFYFNTAGQGRSKIGFDIEVKPSNSQPFDGIVTGTTGPSTFNSGPAGTQSFAFSTTYLGRELPGRTLKVRGRWINPNPLFPRTRWVRAEAHSSGDHDVWLTGTSVGVEPGSLADGLRIDRVAPNPALGNGKSVIAFSLPRAGHVSLELYDLRGALVRRLLSETRSAGPSTVTWDGRGDEGRVAAAGVYMMVLRSGGAIERAKLVRLP